MTLDSSVEEGMGQAAVLEAIGRPDPNSAWIEVGGTRALLRGIWMCSLPEDRIGFFRLEFNDGKVSRKSVPRAKRSD